MTRATRRILFYLSAFLFMAIGIAALFYSNGWRFDPETLSFSTLGGIYFEKIPDGATLTMEKMDLQFNPGFFKSSVFIANLFPKTYTAHAAKDGFQPWLKQISVQPSLVTKIDPIIMLPERPAITTVIAKNVADFWAGPSHIVTKTRSGSLLFRSSILAGTDVAAWSDDGESVITDNGNGGYFLTSLSDPSNTLNLTPAFSSSRKASGIRDASRIQALRFLPESDTSLVVKTGNGLFLFDAGRLRTTVIASTSVSAFAAYGNEIIYATGKSLSAYDTLTTSLQPLAVAGLSGAPVEMHYNGNGTYFTIRTAEGKLLLINRQNLSSAVIFENAQASFFAPGTLKIAVITSDNQLIIHTFGKGYQSAETPKNETLRISGEDAQAIAWHKNGAYLFMRYPDALYLLEANAMPPINLQKVYPDIRKYSYDAQKNTVFILKNGILSELPLE